MGTIPAMRLVDFLLGLAALGTALATGFALLAEQWWLFELFSHFRLQNLAVQMLLLAALAARRRWVFSLALLPFAAANVLPLAPYLPRVPDAVAGARRIVVMNVNLNAANVHYAQLLEIVDKEAPDLLLLAEFNDAWAKAVETLGKQYPYQIRIPRRDNFGIALLSRFSFEQEHPFELESTPAVDARVQAPEGSFRVIGVHLRPPTNRAWSAERNRQLKLLAHLAASREEALMVVGDFNSTPFSPFFRRWLAQSGLRDTARGRGFNFSWPAFLPMIGIPIDHCVVSEEFTVLEHRRLPAFGSDHYPVLAAVALGGKP